MVSIITCSRKQDISHELKNNIVKTIGVEYELIVIDNSKNKYSIFSAYNEGVSRAKGNILCFMHEDIVFHTAKWGEKVLKCFENEQIGLCGVVGGHYAPSFAVPWWQSGLMSGQCLQGYIDDAGYYSSTLDKYSDFIQDKNCIEVASVDGLWFCVPKLLFNKGIVFDEENYSGFHCYDADICFQVRNAGYAVVVVSDILIEHKSKGNMDKQWKKNLVKFHFKWNNMLPMVAGIHLTQEEMKKNDRKILDSICMEIDSYYTMQKQLQNILKSKAYRLGKFILKPLSILKKK